MFIRTVQFLDETARYFVMSLALLANCDYLNTEGLKGAERVLSVTFN